MHLIKNLSEVFCCFCGGTNIEYQGKSHVGYEFYCYDCDKSFFLDKCLFPDDLLKSLKPPKVDKMPSTAVYMNDEGTINYIYPYEEEYYNY